MSKGESTNVGERVEYPSLSQGPLSLWFWEVEGLFPSMLFLKRF